MPNIYLSPSTQEFNQYINEGNEEYWMNLVADAMEPYLEASGIQFTRNTPDMTAASSIAQSNAGNYDFHLALHSNAAPEATSGQVRGFEAYYYPGSVNGEKMADILVRNFTPIAPVPDRVRKIPTTSLGEVRRTKAPSVLIEYGYHDNLEDALWIQNNIDAIARETVRSLTDYFGIPFVAPNEDPGNFPPAVPGSVLPNPDMPQIQPLPDFPQIQPLPEVPGGGMPNLGTPTPELPTLPGTGVVNVKSGHLNIRKAPLIVAPVVERAPKGAKMTVFGMWNKWYVVNYNGTLGYAKADYITLI